MRLSIRIMIAVAAMSAVEVVASPKPLPHRAVVEAISSKLIEGYVFEDSARVIAAKLEQRMQSGRYAGIVDRRELARALTRDLQEISGDRHLRIIPDSAAADSQRAPVRVMVPMSGGGSPGPARRMAAPGSHPRTMGRGLANDGFAKVEILEGSIGYLDLRGFVGSESGRARADSVMEAFAEAKAIVIDLGRNGGGDGFMVQYLASYFFDRSTHLTSRSMRGMESPMESWTLESVPGARHATTPLYLLTSNRTFSAAESFAFGLQSLGRVTIVGESTGGGGHSGHIEPLVEGFFIWLPDSRTFDPRTGKGWQGTGVQPDVAVAYDQALEKALELARR